MQRSRLRGRTNAEKPDALPIHVVLNTRGQEKAAKHPGKHYPFITDRFRAIGPAGFVQQSWVDIDERMLAEARVPNMTCERRAWRQVVQ